MIKSEEIDIEKLEEELIPFDIINEKWAIYELEDNTIIKTKFVLTNIIAYGELNEEGQRYTRFGTQTINIVYSPKEIRGEPDKVWTAEKLEPYKTEINLKFRIIQDPGLYQYETKNTKIEIENRVTQVDKTSKYDKEGMPAYIIRSKTNLTGIQKDISNN